MNLSAPFSFFLAVAALFSSGGLALADIGIVSQTQARQLIEHGEPAVRPVVFDTPPHGPALEKKRARILLFAG